jgi:hypothetical protein
MHPSFLGVFTHPTAQPEDREVWSKERGHLMPAVHGKTYFASYKTRVSDHEYKPKSSEPVIRRTRVRFDARTKDFVFPERFKSKLSVRQRCWRFLKWLGACFKFWREKPAVAKV